MLTHKRCAQDPSISQILRELDRRMSSHPFIAPYTSVVQRNNVEGTFRLKKNVVNSMTLYTFKLHAILAHHSHELLVTASHELYTLRISIIC